MKSSLPGLLVLMALGACSSPEDTAEAIPTDDVSQTTAASSGDDKVIQTVEGVSVDEQTELFAFDFSYPKEAAAIPGLKARLDGELAQARRTLEKEAREARAEARDAGFPFNAYSSGTAWKVTGNTPRYLALVAELYSYQGGAHPNSGTRSLVWDREAGRAIEPLDLFASPTALGEAISAPYCEALDAAREKRRGIPVDAGDSTFGACPTVDQLTIVLESSNGKAFDTLGLLADPYVAGPYAEGAYELSLAVTEAVVQALRPVYREAFRAR